MTTFKVIGRASIGFVFLVEAKDEEDAKDLVGQGCVDTSDIRFPNDFEFDVDGVELAEKD
jgi:hypothetical protein